MEICAIFNTSVLVNNSLDELTVRVYFNMNPQPPHQNMWTSGSAADKPPHQRIPVLFHQPLLIPIEPTKKKVSTPLEHLWEKHSLLWTFTKGNVAAKVFGWGLALNWSSQLSTAGLNKKSVLTRVWNTEWLWIKSRPLWFKITSAKEEVENRGCFGRNETCVGHVAACTGKHDDEK